SAAETAVRAIVARDGLPLFVGGTGLYLRSLLRGVFEGPPADELLRAELEAVAAADGVEALHTRLRAIDPPTAERLHPNDTRRVIRAIEVFEATGRPLSSQHDEGPRPPADRPRGVFWLDRPRDELHRRIDARVEAMLAAGLVDEVRGLLASDRPPGKTARQALGYKEVIAHLAGECSLAEATETLKARTRQFAKRQVTWFRNMEEAAAVQPAEDLASEIARRVTSAVSQSDAGL
ncbi:MAG: tRNA (adenosine(37)-N6)-dimethylallyltransferase MiaA, partial [Planctomycetota bacterium]